MVPRPTLLLLALAASAIGAPATQNDNAVDMKVPEQTPEQMANSDQGHVVVNVFGNFEVEPMCRANGRKCRLNASCCSGYCSWHQGYKCADRSAALEEEEGPLPEKGPDIEPMCRPNNTSK
ncbi:hypothetical protein NUU61_009075 [Penicillium alfredii]|uniref:Uncharacterized protein n=1 Tax=Penicillium alfredii TaxID=1506179 RepID=A0A9W9JX14_9EURO|nr:uncharacterized protein NUU61_009075 [Penicillium alfredii]KAJ5084496.1 hypothetical protein NUU61_009075 [Penicillium alfredii]